MIKTKTNTRRIGKYGIVLFAILVSTALVTGGILSYFGKIETTATAVQMVTIDGKNWDSTIQHKFTTSGGCCECFRHTLKNNGCEDIWLTCVVTGSPDMDGISVSFSLPCHEQMIMDCPTCPPQTHCDCDCPPMRLPFLLKAGRSLEICVCYDFAPMIAPGVYTISAMLVQGVAPS